MSDNEKPERAGALHEVDGIQEEDNKLPRWWLATFFGAVVFGYFYWEYYHVFREGPSIQSEFLQAKQRALAARPVVPAGDGITDQRLIAMSRSHEAEEGAQVFTTTCSACHGMKGEGKIGPNLTDSFWLHGGRPTDIYATISNGYPLKGMPAWLPALGETKVKQVASYVISLRGKNLPGKERQGLEVGPDGLPLPGATPVGLPAAGTTPPPTDAPPTAPTPGESHAAAAPLPAAAPSTVN